MTIDEKIEVIKNINIFKNLSGEDFRQIAEVAKVFMYVSSEVEKKYLTSHLVAQGIDPRQLIFFITNTDSIWTRDYGPQYIFDSDRNATIVDLQYFPSRYFDDIIPRSVASATNLSRYDMPLYFEGGNLMSDYIEIMFKGDRKCIYANPMQYPFKVGDYAIVQADKGEDLGLVHQLRPFIPINEDDDPLKEIIRKPDPNDLKRLAENRTKEEAAFKLCKVKIDKSGLIMKLVDVEYQFDGNKITFYFRMLPNIKPF